MGVSVATGVRRSRTRIVPCFRAARTHAPVRRCSSLIEISFMRHIVTHRWSHRQAMAHRAKTSCCSSSIVPTGQSSFPGAVASGHRDEAANRIDRRQNTRGSRRHPPHRSVLEIKCGTESLAGLCRLVSRIGRCPEARSFVIAQSRHTFLHTENSLIGS